MSHDRVPTSPLSWRRVALGTALCLPAVCAGFLTLGLALPPEAASEETVGRPPRPSTAGEAPPSQSRQPQDAPLSCYLGVVVAAQAVDVVAEHSSRIAEVRVQVGDRVRRHQTLATLEADHLSHELAVENAHLKRAEAELQRVAPAVERAEQTLRRRLALDGLLALEEIESSRFELDSARGQLAVAQAEQTLVEARIEQLEAQLARVSLRAPFDGTVALLYLDTGAAVGPGTPVLRLLSSTGLLTRFAVPPGEAASLRVGWPVRVEIESLRFSTEARVRHIAPEIDSASQMVFVEARLHSSDRHGQVIPNGAAARISLLPGREPPGVGGVCPSWSPGSPW